MSVLSGVADLATGGGSRQVEVVTSGRWKSSAFRPVGLAHGVVERSPEAPGLLDGLTRYNAALTRAAMLPGGVLGAVQSGHGRDRRIITVRAPRVTPCE